MNQLLLLAGVVIVACIFNEPHRLLKLSAAVTVICLSVLECALE